MARKKNLLFITTDQQRFDTMPCCGAEFAITPNLNRLARTGVVFKRCYTPAPVCVPARASIMTGLFPSAHGSTDNFMWLDPDAPKWTTAAVAAGYRTAAVGKMHFSPWDAAEDFQERIICEDKRHFYIPDDHAKFLKEHGIDRPHPVDVPGYYETCGAPDFPYATELYPDVFIADRGAEWIEKNGDNPFALWVSFIGPHDPYDPPPEYSALYKDAPIPEPLPAPDDPETAPSVAEMRAAHPGRDISVFQLDYSTATPEQHMDWRRKYYGNLTLIDEGIGKLLAALETRGILDDTVIVFMSDHGDALGDHGMVFKGYFYESMVHVPLIVVDGSHHGSRPALVGTTDVVAYFHEILGLPLPTDIQGSSLGPALANEDAVLNNIVFSEMPGRMMAYDGRFKYVHAQTGANELYDHSRDPDEMRNLIDDPSCDAEVSRLRAALLAHMLDSTRIQGEGRRKVAYEPRLEMEREFRANRAASRNQ